MSEDPKPKLIIDDDWKTQVQREKEALKGKTEGEPPPADQPAHAADPSAGHSAAGELPPPSFSVLATMLATQAMAAIGLLDDPSQGEPRADPELAKHFIDLLGVLEEKTKGNLTPQEASLLSQTLHELRMMYVSVQK